MSLKQTRGGKEKKKKVKEQLQKEVQKKSLLRSIAKLQEDKISHMYRST